MTRNICQVPEVRIVLRELLEVIPGQGSTEPLEKLVLQGVVEVERLPRGEFGHPCGLQPVKGIVVLRAVGVVNTPGGGEFRRQEPGEGVVRLDHPVVAPRIEEILAVILSCWEGKVQFAKVKHLSSKKLRVAPLEKRPEGKISQKTRIGW